MNNPFLIWGNAVISFSGGRSSGMMTKNIINAHGGTLPSNVKIVFANTGKERSQTLDFVERCSFTLGGVENGMLHCEGIEHASTVDELLTMLKGTP